MFTIMNLAFYSLDILADEALGDSFITASTCADVIFSIIEDQPLPPDEDIKLMPPAIQFPCKIIKDINPQLTADFRAEIGQRMFNVTDHWAGVRSMFENNWRLRKERAKEIETKRDNYQP